MPFISFFMMIVVGSVRRYDGRGRSVGLKIAMRLPLDFKSRYWSRVGMKLYAGRPV